jgi:hypothetical protein
MTDKKTEGTETRKDECLEVFMRVAEKVEVEILTMDPNQWVDWVDPSTGIMMKGDNYNAIYHE